MALTLTFESSPVRFAFNYCASYYLRSGIRWREGAVKAKGKRKKEKKKEKPPHCFLFLISGYPFLLSSFPSTVNEASFLKFASQLVYQGRREGVFYLSICTRFSYLSFLFLFFSLDSIYFALSMNNVTLYENIHTCSICLSFQFSFTLLSCKN